MQVEAHDHKHTNTQCRRRGGGIDAKLRAKDRRWDAKDIENGLDSSKVKRVE